MKQFRIWISRSLIAVIAFAFCGVPEAAQALAAEQESQSTTQQTTQPQSPSATPVQQEPQPPAAEPTSNQPAQQQPRGTAVDPSQGPLTPIPTQTPEATVPGQDQVTNPSPAPPQTQPATSQPQKQQEPLGAAAAEGVKTEGGGASRPAGTAIAPAKQRQVRSFLLKFGAIAAAGVAIGTVYALSRGTSSTPPNSGR